MHGSKWPIISARTRKLELEGLVRTILAGDLAKSGARTIG
eukprot:COSAG05_NODE_2320_length_3240_cov_2.007641_6_plen_40_part_00